MSVAQTLKCWFAVPILLMTTLVIFFFPVIANNQTLVPLDILKEFDLIFKQLNFQSHNYLLSDLVLEFYPDYSFLRQNLARGIFPFWNPHTVNGLPFFADSQVRFFEFSHLLAYPLNIHPLDFPLFSALITLLLGGIFSYGFFRNLLFSPVVALAGSIAFMFSGPLMVWLNYPQVASFVWLPLLLYCVDKIAEEKNSIFLIIGSLATAFSIFGGHLQITLIVLLTTAGYAIFRCIQHRALRRLPLLVVGLAVGILITAVQTGPTATMLLRSESFEVGRGFRAQTSFTDAVKLQLNDGGQNLKLLIRRAASFAMITANPKYYGTPTERNSRYPEGNRYANFNEITIYAGILTLIFALGALGWLKNNLVAFWSATTFTSLVLAADLPIFNLVGYLPVLNRISMNRFRFIFSFSLIVLATFTLQKIYSSIENHRGKTWRILPSAVIVLLATFTFNDLWRTFHNYQTALPKDTSFMTQNPAVKFLQQTTGFARVLGVGIPDAGFRAPLVPNLSLVTGLADIRGYNPLAPKDVTTLADQYLTRRGSFILADAFPQPTFLDLAGVKYLVCPLAGCAGAKTEITWPVAYRDDRVQIIENPRVLPRSYVAYDVIRVNDLKAALQRIRMSTFRPESQITVQTENDEPLGVAPLSNTPILAARIEDYQPNRVTISVTAQHPGVLVLTDTFDRGWRVTVNGAPRKIFPVNGIFRGVAVPAGNSQILYTYLPPHFFFYLTLTAFGLLTIIGWSVYLLKRNVASKATANSTPGST